MKNLKFPENFIWGTAISAYQTEGNNKNTDWWAWEQETFKTPGKKKYPLEKSGIACDFYNKYEEDFDLCKKLNNNAVRLSVEWARIEPQEGIWDKREIEHYKKVLRSAQNKGLKTFVTLHHFTNPLWFSKKGGWQNPKSAKYFERYAKKCAEEFGEWMNVVLTINEPQTLALMAYVRGIWPPQKKSFLKAILVQINFIRAHRKGYKAIKNVVEDLPMGIVKDIVWFEAHPEKGNLIGNLVAKVLTFGGCDFFLRPLKGYMDLIGVNYYFTEWLEGFKLKNLDGRVSDLGWRICPKGLEKVLLNLQKYNLPIYVTENGLADEKDSLREGFLRDMLEACSHALEKGVSLKGYFYWSLLDNFEWHEGYWPKFGLVEVDRENGLERIPRSSFDFYAKVCGGKR